MKNANWAQRLAWLSRDGKFILAAKSLRSFGYGLLSIVLGLYLEQSGFSASAAGLIFTLALLGSALLTALMVRYADGLGRRRILILSSILMIGSGLIFAVAGSLWLLVLAALTGTISATSGEVGPFETVEQAVLPQTAAPGFRNRVFGWYHTLGAVTVSAGSLAAALPAWLATLFAIDTGVGYRLAFVSYSVLAAASLLCFVQLSRSVELARPTPTELFRPSSLQRSRATVTKLGILFSLDALGGGFVIQSFLAYWFALRFEAGGEILGPVFLGVNLLKAVSYPIAVRLADRIGEVNTMVFTHLPSNVLLILIPLMPTLELAIGCLLARHLLAQMDVPVRSSYVVAIVDPEERTAATGILSLLRTLVQSFGPVLGGVALHSAALGAPFFIAGALKIVYDVSLYYGFRTIRPPDDGV